MREQIWTTEQVELLHQLLAEGKKYAEIGEIVGHTPSRVKGKIHRERDRLASLNSALYAENGGKSWTTAEDERALALRSAGHTLAQIGLAIGRSTGAVHARLKTYLAVRDESNPATGRAIMLAVGCKGSETELKRANILHLIDLKRAGHSPSKTELPIEAGTPRSVSVIFYGGSCVGSAAAMCAL